MEVDYSIKAVLNLNQNTSQVILDFKKGDINGDGIVDFVYLFGSKPYGNSSPFRDNINLRLIDGKTGKVTAVMLKQDSGYNPTLFLGDFTGNKADDIFIAIDSGGSGAIAYYYIYTLENNRLRKIFDFENFNNEYQYEVNYLDNYKAEVISKANNKKYILDLAWKGQEYLSEIYNKDGTLKESISGWVDPLSGLFPIDFNRDGTYGLYAMQLIAGRYHADGLGFVQTSLEWDGQSFTHFLQTVGVFGENYIS